MKAILLILLFAISAFSQEPPKSPNEVQPEIPKCVHEDEDEFYASLEHSPPYRLLNIDGRTLSASRTLKTRILYLNLTMDLKAMRMPLTAYKIDEDKRYLILYCLRHQHAYVLEEVTKKKK